MTFIANTDFLTEVKKGNIPGHELISVIGRNPSVGTSFEVMWGPSSVRTKPTGNETWEIVSTDANDTAAGTGAQAVLVSYLDENYAEKSVVVPMNGQTPVTLNADHFRPVLSVVVGVGSTNYNEGRIDIRTQGSGNIQSEIPFVSGDRGFGLSLDGIYTVPAGKFAFGLQLIPFFPKNEDGFIRVVLATDSGPEYVGAELPFYQNGVPLPIEAPFNLPEKTDLVFQGKTTNGGVSLVMSAALLLVDNEFIGRFFIPGLRTI